MKSPLAPILLVLAVVLSAGGQLIAGVCVWGAAAAIEIAARVSR